MPYKFGEYVSTYVDPQSAKISETLRNRFVSNLQANDQLAMAVDQMQAASVFENDLQRKKELQRVAENTLGQLAETGDYENQGMPIRKAAIDFTKEYAPIQENYQRYSQYLNEFNEGLKKGDYTSEHQKNLGAYMLRTANGPYKGFEIDPQTGKVKEGSLFTGPTIYKDPKIMDRVTERLKILHEEKTGNTVQKVGQGADGSLTIESGGTISKIDPAKVQQVVDAVMAEPDVKAYVEQLADMKAYSYQANGQLPQVFNAQLQGYTDAVQKINEALDGGGLSSADRAALKGQLATYTQELNKLKEASQDENLMYSYVKSKAQDEIEAPVRQFASLKGGIYEQTSVYKESYDQKALDDYNRRKQWELEHPEMMAMSEVTADAEGGATVAEKLKTISDLNSRAAEEEKLAQDTSLSETERNAALLRAEKYRIQAKTQQQHIIDAGNQSFSIEQMKKQDPTLIGVLHAMYPTSSAGELALKFQQTFDNPKDQDYKDFENKFIELGNGPLSTHLNRYYTVGPNGEQYARLGAQLSLINNKFKFIKDNDVNYKLGHSVKAASKVYYNSMPGLTQEDRQQATAAADAYFKGWTVPEHVLVKNATEDGTVDLSGTDLAGYKSERWGFREDYGTNGGWELQMVKPGSGDTPPQVKTVILDATQISSPTLDRYTNSPEAKFAKLVRDLDPREKGKETSYDVKGVSGGQYKSPVYKVTVRSEGGEAPLVKIDNLVTGESGTFRRLDDMAITGKIGNGAKVTGYAGLIGVDLP